MTEWKWQFSSPDVQHELGDAPENLMETAELVKFNPVRKVFRINGLYLKLDTRPGRHLRREWNSAAILKKRAIPTVEHLAVGSSSLGELLVTRELLDSMTLRQRTYELAAQNHEKLLELATACAHFTKNIIDAHIFHPDYHSGNILVVSKTGELRLVDVCEVRNATLWDRLFWRSRMESVFKVFTLKLTKPELLGCIAECGSKFPEKSYKAILDNAARHAFHSWPKRREQILKGHHRYTVAENGWLRAVDDAEKPLDLENAQPIEQKDAPTKRLFLAHFLLRQAAIPHRNALALNTADGTLLMEPLPDNLKTPDTLPEDFLDVMAAYGWSSHISQWRLNDNGTPFLADISPVLACVNA